MRLLLRYGLTAVLLTCVPRYSLAGEQPLWELGVGFLTMTSPDYRGSDETRGYYLLFPYFVYRGELVKISRSGIYSRLFETERLHLDLSADGSVPADSSKNAARRGMPDLDATFEIGPVLEICLWKNCQGDRKLQFRWPVRAMFSTDFGSIESRGGITNPNLNFDIENFGPGSGWNFGVAVGPLFATERLHEYYYSVAPAYATSTRPAYTARAGYSGSHITLSLSRRFRNIWIGSFARYDSLNGATFEDSPLVRSDHSFMAGLSIAWILAESKTLVEDEN